MLFRSGADKATAPERAVSDGEEFYQLVARPTADRIFYLAEALRRGWTVQQLFEATRIDEFFLSRMADVVAIEENLRGLRLEQLDADALRLCKRYGLSDAQIARLTGSDEATVRTCRKMLGVVPAFKTVDTCAAEFASSTAYHYKTYDANELDALADAVGAGAQDHGAAARLRRHFGFVCIVGFEIGRASWRERV